MMRESLESFLKCAQELSSHKQVATGLKLTDPNLVREAYKESFDAFVTAAYRWYWEAIRSDRGFLERLASKSDRETLRGIGISLRDQRHDKEHHVYERAANAGKWRERVTESAGPGIDRDVLLRRAMVSELHTALQILSHIALKPRNDPQLADEWRELAAATPEAELLNVYTTLGLSRPSNFMYMLRQYQSHPKVASARTPETRARIAEVIAIGIGLAPLTIAYDKLLDEFDLIGNPAGRSLLMLAHGVEASGHSTNSTVSVLKSVWPIVRERR